MTTDEKIAALGRALRFFLYAVENRCDPESYKWVIGVLDSIDARYDEPEKHVAVAPIEKSKISDTKITGHDWEVERVIHSNPPAYDLRCKKCGVARMSPVKTPPAAIGGQCKPRHATTHHWTLDGRRGAISIWRCLRCLEVKNGGESCDYRDRPPVEGCTAKCDQAGSTEKNMPPEPAKCEHKAPKFIGLYGKRWIYHCENCNAIGRRPVALDDWLPVEWWPEATT